MNNPVGVTLAGVRHPDTGEQGSSSVPHDLIERPQGLLEYNAAIDGARLNHLIAQKSRDLYLARIRRDGTAAGRQRAWDKLVRQLLPR